MKIVSIDIEATGLDPEKCSILEFSAVLEDTNNLKELEDLPHFTCYVHTSSFLTGSAFALNMNRHILEVLGGQERLGKEKLEKYRFENKILDINDLATNFYYFLQINSFVNSDLDLNLDRMITKYKDFDSNEYIVSVFNNKSKKVGLNILSKNFNSLDRPLIEKIPRWKQIFKLRSLYIEPSSFCINWKKDEKLPHMGLCKLRSGLGDNISHTAYEDALDNIRILRKQTNNYE